MKIRTELSDATEQKRRTLINNHNSACWAYTHAFCEKHEYDIDGIYWVGKNVGGIAEINGYYVDLETIRVDVDSLCSEDEFLKWYDYCLRIGTLGAATPNFDSWLRKCPIRSEAEILEMEKTRAKIEELEENLREMCERDKHTTLAPAKKELIALKNLTNPKNPE